jgi:hypothetical protein
MDKETESNFCRRMTYIQKGYRIHMLSVSAEECTAIAQQVRISTNTENQHFEIRGGN